MALLSDLYKKYGQPVANAARQIYNLPKTASQSKLSQGVRLGLSNQPVNGIMAPGDFFKSSGAGVQGALNVVRDIPALAYGAAGAVTPGRTFQGNIQQYNKVVPRAQFATNATQHAIQQGVLPGFAKNITAAGELAGGMLVPLPGISKIAALEKLAPLGKFAGYTAARAGEGYAYGAGTQLAQTGDFKEANRAGLVGAATAGIGNTVLSPRLVKAAGDHAVENYRIAEGANDLIKKLDAKVPTNRIIDNLPGGVPVRSGMMTNVSEVPNQEVLNALVNRGKDGKGARYIKAPQGTSRVVEDAYGTGNLLSFQPDNPKFAQQLDNRRSQKTGFVDPNLITGGLAGQIEKVKPSAFKVGDVVSPTDRNNFGKVTAINPDGSYRVSFRNKKDGTSFSKTFSPGELKTTVRTARGQVKLPVSLVGPLSETAGTKGFGSTGKALEEKLVDNNKNFNVNRLNISPEAKQNLSENVDNLGDTFKKVTGERLSNREAIQMAHVTSKVLDKTVGRDSTLAWQAAMVKTRQQLAEQAQKGEVTPEFLQNLVAVKSQGTDIARKLQSLSINADGHEATAMEKIVAGVLKSNDNVDEILKAAQGIDFNDPKQAATFYRQFVKPKSSEWLDLLRYNSMLSSPNTHINNVFSNIAQSAVVKPVEKTIAGTVDFLLHGGGPKQTQFASEGPAYVKGYFKSVGDAAHSFADVMSGKAASTNLDMRNIPLAPQGGVAGAAEKGLTYPMKLLEGMDQFFTTMARGGETASLGVKIKNGVKVAAPEIIAAERAAKTLFRGDLGDKSEGHLLNAIDAVTNQVQGLRNSDNPIVSTISKFTIPFLKTPVNIFKQGIEYSPAGILTLPGNADKTAQLAKAAIGSAVFAGAATLLGAGRLTWAEPTSENERNAFRAAGMQPYAVKIGNKWISYAKLGPLGYPMAMVAALDDAQKNRKLDEGTLEQILSGLAKIGGFLADQTYAKGVGDLIKSAKTENGVAQVIANDTQQLIPYRALLGWIARLEDDTQRQPDAKAGTIEKQIQYTLAQIPGLSKNVPARLDPQGNPIKNSNNVLNAFSPLKITNEVAGPKAQYEAIANTRVNNALAKQQLAASQSGQPANAFTPSSVNQPNQQVIKLANDKYGYVGIDGSYHQERTEDAAKLGLAKEQVTNGKSDRIQVGNTLVVSDPTSSTGYKTYDLDKVKQDTQNQLLTNTLNIAKTTGDYKSWLGAQQQVLANLQVATQKLDPVLDQAQILKNQATAAGIQNDIAKYQSYGGSFKKPKKGRSGGSIKSPARLSGGGGAKLSISKPRVIRPKARSSKIKLAKNTIKQPKKA